MSDKSEYDAIAGDNVAPDVTGSDHDAGTENEMYHDTNDEGQEQEHDPECGLEQGEEGEGEEGEEGQEKQGPDEDEPPIILQMHMPDDPPMMDYYPSEGTKLIDEDKGFGSGYAQKKTLAKGCLDFALLMANASQLKTLVRLPPEARNEFYTAVLIMISLSLGLQVAVGVVLIVLGMNEPHKKKDYKRTEKLNNVSVILIMIITVINLLISSIGISE